MRSSTEVTPAVPAGWKLVPIEPTEEMKVSGCDHDDPLGRLVDWQGKDVTTREVVAGVFGAMIAAAPTPVDQVEPARYQRRPVPDVHNTGWVEVDEADIPHYRRVGQEIRALYIGQMPAAATEADHG